MSRTDASNDRVAALIATELLGDPSQATITRAFEQVGLHRGVERAYYYRLDEAAGAFELVNEWHPSERPAMGAIDRFARLPLAILPEALRAALARGRALRLPHTRGLLGAPVDDIVDAANDRAVVLVPVVLDDALIGIAGFSAARDSAWTEGDVALLEVVARGVAHAVERCRVDEALRASEARFRAMCAEAEAARAEADAILCRISDAFISFDLEGRYKYVNDPAAAMIQRPRAELIGRTPWEVHPDLIGGAFHVAFLRAAREQQPVTTEQRSTDGQRTYEVRIYPSPTGTSAFAEDITERRRREEQLASEADYLRREVVGFAPESDAVGFGEGLRQVIERVSLVAAGNTSVLITGETGTGKELVARAIHERSPRRERLLVKVNCAAISSGLVESELFGHEKGAFTGALARRKGRFELAHGGTLFLDEVGELPPDVQAKLLRVLQERELERVGGSETIRVDVRVVAATNRDLADMVAKGKFREDLYYRLNVFPVALPPLRERVGDVPLLVHAFMRRFARGAGRRIDAVAPEAMRRLQDYRWPGNVRELQNVVERAVILSTGRVLGLDALPELGGGPTATVFELPAPSMLASLPANEAVAGTRVPFVRPPGFIDELERAHVARTLAETSWLIEGEHGAARRLGLHPNTLRSRLKRYGLKRPGSPTAAVG
jgi:formate hydrogenlyase transcriptional activator